MTEEIIKQPDFTEPVFYDHIGVFENFVKWEFCDSLCEVFEYWYNKKHFVGESSEHTITSIAKNDFTIDHFNDGESQFPKGGMGRKDHQLYLEVCDTTMTAQVNQAIGQAFELYVQKYKGLVDSCDPISSWTCKLQRTDPGGGYHVWHCENGNFLYRDRVLTWMIYLNDIPPENGGGTDFYHQATTFHPKKGTIVLWPATYTHMHRGAFLTGDKSKYIATGWFLREPGNVTNRTVSEAMGKSNPIDKLN
jgi:hypothetical protein|tara:strand:- start:114 stop:860 length:747 start_codon:yes stop_codon:yes gene_type:complete